MNTTLAPTHDEPFNWAHAQVPEHEVGAGGSAYLGFHQPTDLMSNVEIHVQPEVIRLVMSGPLTVTQVPGVRASLASMLQGLPAHPIRVELGGVSEADSAGLLLLLGLSRSLLGTGRVVSLSSCSDAVASVAWDHGVATSQACLGLPYETVMGFQA